MKCPRCDLPVEPDESQCSVCGEILHSAGDRSAVFPKRTDNPPPKREPSAESRATSDEPLSFLAYNPSLTRYAIWWMVACAVFAALFTGVAAVHYSIEAMYGAFICGGLIAIPLIFLLFTKILQIFYAFRKEVMIVTGFAVAVGCFYLVAKGIERSNIQVDTAGVHDLATNENFTRTLVTLIICGTVLLGLIPVVRTIVRGLALRTGTKRYASDTEQEMQIRTSENTTTLQLKKMELEYEIEMRKLELEQERLKFESERTLLLAANQQKLLENNTGTVTHPAPPPPPPATTATDEKAI